MTGLSEIYSVVGKALDAPHREELIFETTDGEHIYVRNDKQLDRVNEDKGRQSINNFISRTIFTSLTRKGAVTLVFNSAETKKCQKYLQQRFGEKDETAIKFIESLEKATSNDIQKFADLERVIYYSKVDISKASFETDIDYYLVVGVFDDAMHVEPVEKIFLQKIMTMGDLRLDISHEELPIDLFRFSQIPRVKSFMERALIKRGY